MDLEKNLFWIMDQFPHSNSVMKFEPWISCVQSQKDIHKSFDLSWSRFWGKICFYMTWWNLVSKTKYHWQN